MMCCEHFYIALPPFQVEIAEVICRDMLESVTLFFGCNMIFLDSLAVLLR